MDDRRLRSLVQPALILGAGFLWAWFPLPTVSALVWAYLVIVLGAGLLRGRGRGQRRHLPWELALPVSLMLLGPFLWALEREGPALWTNSQLEGLLSIYRDRARGLGPVRLHPIVVRDDQPQVLWAYGDGPAPLQIQLGANGPSLLAARIGPKVWRAVYDPRAHGGLKAEGPFIVTVGGREVEATAVRAGPRPDRLDEIPGGGALAVSAPTDEVLYISAAGELRRFPTADRPIRAVAISATVAAVIHRFSPHLHRIALPSGQPLPPVPLAVSVIDIASDGRRTVGVIGKSPPRLQIFSPSNTWQVDVPFVPRRLIGGGWPGTWFVEAEVEAALYRVTAPGEVQRVAQLGRPLYAARSLPHGCLEALVPDYRPLGDPGPNHHVADHRVRLCPDRRPDAETTFTRNDAGVILGGAGPRAISSGGAIAFTGSDEVETPAWGRQPSPLPSPNGIARLGPDRWAVSSAVAGAIAIIDEAGHLIARHDLIGAETPRADRLRRGERAFMEATKSGAACETCHLDRDSDRGAHDIGHPSPRPTLSVRGVAGTAPFLRVASYPDLSGLEHFAQTILGGYHRHSETRAQDLLAYVESLPPLEPIRKLSAEGWREGWQAFESAGCPSCHTPPAFTNRAQYPQPLLFPGQPQGVLLDTPSLLGVAASPPYLHDGRAPTLRALFEDHDPAHRHGRFNQLDAGRREQLLHFLEAL